MMAPWRFKSTTSTYQFDGEIRYLIKCCKYRKWDRNGLRPPISRKKLWLRTKWEKLFEQRSDFWNNVINSSELLNNPLIYLAINLVLTNFWSSLKRKFLFHGQYYIPAKLWQTFISICSLNGKNVWILLQHCTIVEFEIVRIVPWENDYKLWCFQTV